jgi:hypothetical protein
MSTPRVGSRIGINIYVYIHSKHHTALCTSVSLQVTPLKNEKCLWRNVYKGKNVLPNYIIDILLTTTTIYSTIGLWV